VIQVWITPRIHKYLGIGFALMILPTNLALSAVLIFLNPSLWAPSVASVSDRSIRYTVDKTTREVLFLPLPSTLRQEVKPFVDVTVDRMSRGLGSLFILMLIQPWGLSLAWYQLSIVSLGLALVWYFMSYRAKREYLASFRRSLETREMKTEEVRLNVADLSTVETLIQELAHPDPARVVYAIDVLESLDKRNLVTPLLLHHESPIVRERALRALGASGTSGERWMPQVRRALTDPEPDVRAEALRALATLGHEDAVAHARPLLTEADPRIRTTAALALAASAMAPDLVDAHTALVDIIADTSDAMRPSRRQVAAALGTLPDARFRRLLVPLLYDPAPDVVEAAMAGVRTAGASDYIFVPALITLLRNRQVKGAARETLVSYGEGVLDALAHFMRDPEEDIWLRRHIPTTIARIGTQRAANVLLAGLDEPDGFLRYKIIAALERLRRTDVPIAFDRTKLEPLVIREARRYLAALSLHSNLFVGGGLPSDTLLSRALEEKMTRAKDRAYRLLSLIFPWQDVFAAQWTLTNGDARSRASASEYLDNLLPSDLRKVVMPVVEELPREERVRRANVVQRTRPRNVEETLLELINDEDQVIAAAAIDVVRQQRLWALAPDIEHVLAHRDVRDWYVFEEASWALAEQRMPPERRRELWMEPLPAAVLAERLRELPLFRSVSVDELFRIATAAKQVRHETGTSLQAEGATVDTIHLLLDGTVVASGTHAAPETIEAPAALGFAEALEGASSRRSVKTSGVAVTLALTSDELRSLLADNPELVRGLFAEMANRAEVPGCPPVQATGAAVDLERLAAGGIEPVEKILALQRIPYFSHLSAIEMRHLAGIARTILMTEGSALFAASTPPATWLLLSGEVQIEQPGGEPLLARGGDVIGSFCALSGKEVGHAAAITRSGFALKISAEDLFELLGERPDLLRQAFAGMTKTAAANATAVSAVR
jgi:HEAT repeat protein/CRP-like cAMP-binding protein